jgi:hypothetical protein
LLRDAVEPNALVELSYPVERRGHAMDCRGKGERTIAIGIINGYEQPNRRRKAHPSCG